MKKLIMVGGFYRCHTTLEVYQVVKAEIVFDVKRCEVYEYAELQSTQSNKTTRRNVTLHPIPFFDEYTEVEFNADTHSGD